MPVTLGNITVEARKRTNHDGTTTPYHRICITLTNSDSDAVEQKVTFYRVLIPKEGAKPSGRADVAELCSAGPRPVPGRQVVTHGTSTAETDGWEAFCCDVDDDDEDDSAFGAVKIWAEAGAPPPGRKPIEFGEGSSGHKTVKMP